MKTVTTWIIFIDDRCMWTTTTTNETKTTTTNENENERRRQESLATAFADLQQAFEVRVAEIDAQSVINFPRDSESNRGRKMSANAMANASNDNKQHSYFYSCCCCCYLLSLSRSSFFRITKGVAEVVVARLAKRLKVKTCTKEIRLYHNSVVR